MPNGRIDLRDRRVVMAVLVISAALAVVNWRVFQPMRTRHARVSALQEEMTRPPDDLGEMVVFAASQLSANPPSGMPDDVAGAERAAVRRDPFMKNSPEAQKAEVPRSAGRDGLFCDAVLLGGGRPAAIINGKAYRPGDRVGGYVVGRIGYEGVELLAGDGRIMLEVAARERGNRYLPPVVNGSGGRTAPDANKQKRGGGDE